MRLPGYTRVSTSNQDAQLQVDALATTGVQKRDVFADVTSGSKTAIERRGMKKLLEYAEDGDAVVIWRVDRLGRSLIHVLNTGNLLRERGVQVRSISDGIDPSTSDGIDPSTSTGRLMLNMLAEYEEGAHRRTGQRRHRCGPRERDPVRPAPVESGGHRGQARDRRGRPSTWPHRRGRCPPPRVEPRNALPPPASPRGPRERSDVAVSSGGGPVYSTSSTRERGRSVAPPWFYSVVGEVVPVAGEEVVVSVDVGAFEVDGGTDAPVPGVVVFPAEDFEDGPVIESKDGVVGVGFAVDTDDGPAGEGGERGGEGVAGVFAGDAARWGGEGPVAVEVQAPVGAGERRGRVVRDCVGDGQRESGVQEITVGDALVVRGLLAGGVVGHGLFSSWLSSRGMMPRRACACANVSDGRTRAKGESFCSRSMM